MLRSKADAVIVRSVDVDLALKVEVPVKVVAPVTSSVPGTLTLLVHSTPVPPASV